MNPSFKPKFSISGFPEYLPGEQALFDGLAAKIEQVFQSFGGTKIHTPIVEKVQHIAAKGVDSKEIYALARLQDAGKPIENFELALHFDLTVPFARYVNQRASDLSFPFRRYQMQPVWRGERAQSGRFREFWQCDYDIVSNKTVFPVAFDAEILEVVARIFRQLDIGSFHIKINNRKLLTGYFQQLFGSSQVSHTFFTLLDNLEKIGREKFINQAKEQGFAEPKLEIFLQEREVWRQASNQGLSPKLMELLENSQAKNSPVFQEGLGELMETAEILQALDLPPQVFSFDLAIVRGLDYYTGIVFETFLDEHPEFGSLCSGGRYANLCEQLGATQFAATQFAATRQKFQGVGMSIGLSRLFDQAMRHGLLAQTEVSSTKILICLLAKKHLKSYLKLAQNLRYEGVDCEVFLDEIKLGEQLKYASNKGIRYAVIAGDNEFAAGHYLVKKLQNGEQIQLKYNQLIEFLREQENE